MAAWTRQNCKYKVELEFEALKLLDDNRIITHWNAEEECVVDC